MRRQIDNGLLQALQFQAVIPQTRRGCLIRLKPATAILRMVHCDILIVPLNHDSGMKPFHMLGAAHRMFDPYQ